MKVELERTYPMPAPADAAWALLQDIERTAACMPGARITERVDDRNYKGTVSVRLGPANLSFRGDVEVKEVDAAQRQLRLVGKGKDATGASAAEMSLLARIEAVDAASCNLIGNSEVTMSGKAATFGARMAGAVADQVLKQFVANFAAALPAASAPAPAAAAAAGPEAGTAAPAPAAPAPAAQTVPLNGLALVWAIFKDWLKGLFGSRK